MRIRQTLSLLVLLCFSGASFADPHAEAEPTEQADNLQSVLPLEDLRVFTKAYDHIRNAYIKEIDDKTLLEYAIRGMLDELDPHSSYLDASSFDDLQVHTTGEFGGLGIEVGMENGFVKVISPIDDTPAERAGIEAGDLIIKIDDTAIKGLTLNEAVEKMRGPKGSEIRLTIVRDGVDQPIEMTVIRDTIKVKSVRSELLEEHYGYLRIAQFQVNTGRDIKDAVKKLLKSNDIRGFVLDLRNNPGGLLQASVEVADTFLDGGMVVYTEGRMPSANAEYKAEPGDLTNGLPVVVLVNEGSASASEIVAGALQDHRRAIVLGTQSFGKGSVQTVIPITDDRAIKITTSLYFTPNGRSIQADGIKPDIIAERVKVTSVQGHNRLREAQLAGHLDNQQKSEKLNADDKEEDGKQRIIDRDHQLYEALNILKGLNLYRQSPAKVSTNTKKNEQDEQPSISQVEARSKSAQ